MEIEINKIKPDPNQPRKTFDEETLTHLAESILGNGLLKPIEIDENNIIIDGERRWRAHKLAGLKKINYIIIKIKGNGKIRLRRQLISDIQDEEIPTKERYTAIAKLYKLDKQSQQGLLYEDFCKSLGISESVLTNALDYVGFVEEEPELAEEVSPHIITETKTLPKEEREEIIKEFKGKTEKKKDMIREMVKDKKKELETKKEIEELRKVASRKEIKIKTDKERLFQIRDEIINTQNDLNKLMSNVRWVKKTKFYLNTPKQRDGFIKFIEGASERARKWADELDNLKEEISIEIIKE